MKIVGAYSRYALFCLLASSTAASAQVQREPDGRATIRAVRLTEPLRFDGALDEAVYQSTAPITDFIQNIPDHGKPASQRTEAWVVFDGTHVYVSARCWDTRPPSQWTANEMRRDQLSQQDNFGFVIDTYYDRRNGYMFYTSVLGGRSDSYVSNESAANADFN